MNTFKLITIHIIFLGIFELSAQGNSKSYERTYILYAERDSIGYMNVKLNWENKKRKLIETTVAPNFFEKSTSYFDKNFEMDSVSIAGNIGQFSINCLSYVKTDSIIGHKGFPVDSLGRTTLVKKNIQGKKFYERSVSLLLLSINLNKDYEHQFIQYNATDGNFYTIKVFKDPKLQSIVVNGKVYECRVILFSGGIASQKFYLHKNEIIKIEVLGQPYTYELVK